MNTRYKFFISGLLIVSLGTAPEALARDRPGTPTDVFAGLYEAPLERLPRVLLTFRNTATERVSFWVEWTENGVRMPDDFGARLDCPNHSAQQYFCHETTLYRHPRVQGRALTDHREFPHGVVFGDLKFNSEYCFRLLARDREGVISEIWSAWACTRTPAPPASPQAPEKVQLTFLPGESGRGGQGTTQPPRALLEWLAPLAARDVAWFEVEEWNAYARHWQRDDIQHRGVLRVRGGGNTSGEREVIVNLLAQTDPKAAAPRFRVCSVNVAGRACTTAVAELLLTTATAATPIGSARAAAEPVNAPTGRDTTPVSASPIQSSQALPPQSTQVRQHEPVTQTATQTRSAEVSRGATPLQQAAPQSATSGLTTRPAAEEQQQRQRELEEQIRKQQEQAKELQTEIKRDPDTRSANARLGAWVTGSDSPGELRQRDASPDQDSAGSRHLEPAPPSPVIQGQAQTPGISPTATAQASATRAGAEGSQPAQRQATANPAQDVMLNPQPLPPKATQPAPRQATVSPGQDVSLNPQPLPPKTVLMPRQGTVLQSAPMQTTGGGTGGVNPQGQIQGTASGAAIDGVVSSQNPDLSGQLVCQGGQEPALGSAYRTSEDGAEIQMMYISFAEQATQSDARGLVPGRCGFIGQPATGSGASIVYFKAPAADRENMRRSLARSSNYWRFVVQKNESGYYDASEHAQWTPPKNVAQALMFTRIRVNPNPRGVEFRFDGPADSNPRLMVVNGPLTVNPNGTRSSVGAPLHLKAVRVSDAKPTGVAEFFASSDQHRDTQAANEWTKLVPSAQYHYFLGNAGSTSQQEGTFATPAESGAIAEVPGKPGGGVRTDLFQLDDSTTLIADGKPVTAGDFKRQVAALDSKSQSSSVSARPKISRSTAPEPSSDPPLQQARLPGNVGSKLKEDCETREPRLHVVRGRISSGQQFTVEGACLGTPTGVLEMIGQFPGGTLTPTIVRWDPWSIVATMPQLQGIADHVVALSVVRSTDRKRSDAKRFDYVAAREIVEIPDANFSPSSNYVRKHHDWHRGTARQAKQPRPGPIVFQVNKHPACTLDRMEAVGRVGTVWSIDGSDPGNSPAKITVNFHWHCKYEFTEYRLAKFGFEDDIRSDTNCEVAFDVRAWASCPAGISP